MFSLYSHLDCVALDRCELGECAIACMERHLRSNRPDVYKFALPVRTIDIALLNSFKPFQRTLGCDSIRWKPRNKQAAMQLFLSIICVCSVIGMINAASLTSGPVTKPHSQIADVSESLLSRLECKC